MWTSLAVFSGVKGTLFDLEGGFWREAHRMEDRGVEIGHTDRMFCRNERTFVCGVAIEVAAFHSAAEHEHAAAACEVAVLPIVFHLREEIDF